MKILIVLSTLLFISPIYSQEKTSFDFLLGSWERSNNQVNKQTFEHWTQDEAGVYIGLGYTLQAADTVFKEEMKILWIEHAYFLIVSGVNADPTHFEVTSHGESMFVCENEENEFPKKIAYRLENEQLIAVISDEQNQVVFTFKAQ